MGLKEEGFSYLGEKEEAMQVNMSENRYNPQRFKVFPLFRSKEEGFSYLGEKDSLIDNG